MNPQANLTWENLPRVQRPALRERSRPRDDLQLGRIVRPLLECVS
jgi:hypothetical protein